MSGLPLGPGTLYGALARLERRGLIEALGPEDRRRPYRLTGLRRGDASGAARRMRFAQTVCDARTRAATVAPVVALAGTVTLRRSTRPIAALTGSGPARAACGAGRRALAHGPCSGADSRPIAGLVAPGGDRRDGRLRLAAVSGDHADAFGSARMTELLASEPGVLPIARRLPGLRRRMLEVLRVLVDPGEVRLVPGRRPDRRRDRPERPRPLADVPASRLPAEPLSRGLLVPLPVPSVALRPAGIKLAGSSTGRLRAGWTAMPCAWMARAYCPSTRRDHPRATSRCARPARVDPAAVENGCV